jgi:hypothetical protein
MRCSDIPFLFFYFFIKEVKEVLNFLVKVRPESQYIDTSKARDDLQDDGQI